MNSNFLHEEQPFNTFRCPYPWTSLLVNHDGGISFCCWHYPIANISDVSKNAIDEIWNSKIAQSLRKCWNEGKLKGTPCSKCLGLHMFKQFAYPIENMPIMPGDTYANVQLNIAEFNAGKTILKSMPVEIQYVPSTLCNIHCIHCYQPPVKKNNKSYIQPEDLLNFYHHLGSKAAKNWFVGGEPLCIRQTFQLINEFSPEQKMASEAIFCTNGLLVKDKFESILGFRKYRFIISIASFRKDIYEYVHQGSSFKKLIENLQFLVKSKVEGMDISLTQNMVIMRSNFADLESISRFTEIYKIDEVWVTPVQPAYSKYDILKNENIFQLPHLLQKIPNWKGIIAQALRHAMDTGNEITCNNLQYLDKQLPSSIVLSYTRSAWNLFLWQFRVTAIKLLSLIPLNKQKKLILVFNRLISKLHIRNSGETV